MKRYATLLVATAAAAAAFAGDFGLSLSATGAAKDVAKDKTRTFELAPEANLSYAIKLDKPMKAKVGLLANDKIVVYPKDAGDTTAMALKLEPYAEFSYDALSTKLSFPFYKGIASDKKSALSVPVTLNDTKVKYDEILLASYAKVGYKVAASKELSFTPAVEASLYFVPAVRFDYVKPSLNVAYTSLVSVDLPLTVAKLEKKVLDNEYNFSMAPKVTVGLDDLGLKGYKVFADAAFSLIHKEAKGLNTITPGFSGKIDAFSFEAKVGLGNLDKAKGEDMTVNPSLKMAYALSF